MNNGGNIGKETEWFVVWSVLCRSCFDVAIFFCLESGCLYDCPFGLSLYKYIESWILFVLFLLCIPKKFDKPSSFVISILFFGCIVPLLVLYPWRLDSSRYFLYAYLFCCLFLIAISRANFSIVLPDLRIPISFLILINGLVVALVIFYIAKLRGFNLNFDVSKVYEVRRSLTLNFPFNYLLPLATQGCIVFLLIVSLMNKRWEACVIVVLCQLYFLGTTNFKSMGVYILFVFASYYLLQRVRSFTFIPFLLTTFTFISVTCYLVFDWITLLSLYPRRALFMPANLSFIYYEIFNTNDFVYWSNSILKHWIDYPYGEAITSFVGDWLGHHGMSANNGFLSSGYMQAGVLGMAIYVLIYGFLLKILDGMALHQTRKDVKVALVCAVSVPMTTCLLSSDLPVTLNTHGLAFSLFNLWVFSSHLRRQRTQRRENNKTRLSQLD